MVQKDIKKVLKERSCGEDRMGVVQNKLIIGAVETVVGRSVGGSIGEFNIIYFLNDVTVSTVLQLFLLILK